MKTISKAVIGRLPRYYRYLGELKEENIERISSGELSERMHATASQIRQDLNCFGGFGQQGYGYNVSYLYDEIGKILNLDKEHNMIIIGSGHLGQAIANYANFEKRGFKVVALFDKSEDVIGKKVRDVEIRGIDTLEEYLQNNDIDIVALTLPKEQARKIAEILVANGIKAIWNFAHTDLELPDDVIVENVHLSESLMKLAYNYGVSEAKKKAKSE